MYYLYILQCIDKTLYTGITTNLARRVIEHNTSILGAKYTRARRPVRLVFEEEFLTRSSACQREAEIKRMTRSQKINLIGKKL
jgi:putative endonuclease